MAAAILDGRWEEAASGACADAPIAGGTRSVRRGAEGGGASLHRHAPSGDSHAPSGYSHAHCALGTCGLVRGHAPSGESDARYALKTEERRDFVDKTRPLG